MISAIIMITLCIGLGLLYIKTLPKPNKKAGWSHEQKIILNDVKPSSLKTVKPIQNPAPKPQSKPDLKNSHAALKRRKLLSQRNSFAIKAKNTEGISRRHALSQMAIYDLRLNSPQCTITDMAEFKRKKNA